MKLDKILHTAVQYGASDIYINAGSRPFLRLHGELVEIQEHEVLSEQAAEEYIYETMTEAQKKIFAEELDIDYAIELPGIIRLRANAFWQRRGIGGIFRLIPTLIKSMDELNLPQQLKHIPQFANGIVLVTGPTGSGKSTTLASIVAQINNSERSHIVTIEDPIEFVHDNKMSVVDQREVGTHTRSFAQALRASLREDPNVILIGEMRDMETMSLALTAAETGHLVLTTLHTSGAAKAIDRVIDAFPPNQQNQIRTQFSESLRAIIWQNLLKKKDGTGMVGAYEILFNNHAVANMIRKNKTYQIPSVLETGINEGMQTMKRSLLGLIEAGVVSEETAREYMLPEMEV
ncbi:type IV pili twitching motility protein PilT [Candidatus Peregrinibacteria bacterium CG_4_9_14_0_2_um_filter_53_11]|nr:MAG: type IV pili twitching motility protein PilT [Candidatus Peregrinibacteria bacterium CG_4_9_14_0_2_um_filter_53_11]